MTGVANFKAAVNAAWVATAPPTDGSGVAYSIIDTLNEERTDGRHRQIFWTNAVRAANAETVRNRLWDLSAIITIERRERTKAAFDDAMEEEIRVLADAFDNLTALGAGVYEGYTPGGESDPEIVAQPPRAGGHPRPQARRIIFPFQVLVGG